MPRSTPKQKCNDYFFSCFKGYGSAVASYVQVNKNNEMNEVKCEDSTALEAIHSAVHKP